MKWTRLCYLSGGHSIHKDAFGRISICDQSGDNPDEADDGPCYIPEDVSYSYSQWKHQPTASFKVLDAEGSPNGTVTVSATDPVLIEIARGKLLRARCLLSKAPPHP